MLAKELSLIGAGIRSVELTLTTPGTIERLPKLLAQFGDAADIGIGTVTGVAQLTAAVDAGAHYLVTPITDPDLVEVANRAGVPIVPGGLTPTELFAAWRAGAAAVKIFPASQVGPGYLTDLRGPFPDIAAVPSGGVDLEGAAAWLHAGAAAVSVGGPLLGDAVRGGDIRALHDRTTAFVATCGQVTT
jgi:2-dehydro-3-deoxyphosphogluconate aldolase/(4S)-4-hydroxy-2-oxoglutarate aldolase